MSQIITTQSLIDEVRSLIDESNTESIQDELDIIPALNRAQNYAADILSRHYESPLLTHVNIPSVSGQLEYDIPEDAFEQRLEKVEIKIDQNGYQALKNISYRDSSFYDQPLSSGLPIYYTVVGGRFKVFPSANTNYPMRVWYLKDPLPLVKEQGRINIVNLAGNYVIIDAVGSDLTTESDQLNSYVNVIDAQTGVRKATFQVQNIIGNKVTFKTTPIRTNVLNIDIDTDMSDLLVNSANTDDPSVSINPDDFLCVIKGTCVPVMKKPFSNFLVEYAVAELTRKLGGDSSMEMKVLEKLEQQVERSWVGREHSLRVKKVSNRWPQSTSKRYYYGRNS